MPQSGIIAVMAGEVVLKVYSWLALTVPEFPAASMVGTLTHRNLSLSLASLLPSTAIA